MRVLVIASLQEIDSSYSGIDFESAIRPCGRRDDDVAAARARGLSVRAREAIVVVKVGVKVGVTMEATEIF